MRREGALREDSAVPTEADTASVKPLRDRARTDPGPRKGHGRGPAERDRAYDRIVERRARSGDGEYRFADRRDAGRRLAAMLAHTRREDPVVLGVSFGGVPVGAEVARALESPLDVLMLERVHAPKRLTHAIGAVAERGGCAIDERAVGDLAVGAAELDGAIARARHQLSTRLASATFNRPRVAVAGRTVLLVDDGLGSPYCALAAMRSLRRRGAARVILALPVAAFHAVEELRDEVDELVYVEMAEQIPAIDSWYEDFDPTSEEEVYALLSEHSGAVQRQVAIDISPGVVLHGDLVVPWGASARGVVVFACGTDSSRHSPHNRRVAGVLNDAAIATLLIGLSTAHEKIEVHDALHQGVPAERLVAVTRWLRCQPETARMAVGYYGTRCGSAAVIGAAAQLKAGVGAAVVCDGRPDLTDGRLDHVAASLLLIVSEADSELVDLNRAAQRHLRCENELAVISGTERLSQPLPADEVAQLTASWFVQHLPEVAPAIDAGDHLHHARRSHRPSRARALLPT